MDPIKASNSSPEITVFSHYETEGMIFNFRLDDFASLASTFTLFANIFTVIPMYISPDGVTIRCSGGISDNAKSGKTEQTNVIVVNTEFPANHLRFIHVDPTYLQEPHGVYKIAFQSNNLKDALANRGVSLRFFQTYDNAARGVVSLEIVTQTSTTANIHYLNITEFKTESFHFPGDIHRMTAPNYRIPCSEMVSQFTALSGRNQKGVIVIGPHCLIMYSSTGSASRSKWGVAYSHESFFPYNVNKTLMKHIGSLKKLAPKGMAEFYSVNSLCFRISIIMPGGGKIDIFITPSEVLDPIDYCSVIAL